MACNSIEQKDTALMIMMDTINTVVCVYSVSKIQKIVRVKQK